MSNANVPEGVAAPESKKEALAEAGKGQILEFGDLKFSATRGLTMRVLLAISGEQDSSLTAMVQTFVDFVNKNKLWKNGKGKKLTLEDVLDQGSDVEFGMFLGKWRTVTNPNWVSAAESSGADSQN